MTEEQEQQYYFYDPSTTDIYCYTQSQVDQVARINNLNEQINKDPTNRSLYQYERDTIRDVFFKIKDNIDKFISITDENVEMINDEKEELYKETDEYKESVIADQIQQKEELLNTLNTEIEVLKDTIELNLPTTFSSSISPSERLLELKKLRVQVFNTDASIYGVELPSLEDINNG